MDIPRKSQGRKRQVKRIIYALSAIIAIGAITVGVSRLKPAAPTVERSTVWIDTVKRGPMLRQVRGLGSLVPEEIRWIPATTQGRVERILVKPGAEVRADTVLIELTNPEAEQAAIEANSQLKAAEAEYISLRVQLERRLLDQKATAATVQADFSQAKLQAEVNDELAKQGLISQLNLKVSKVRAEEMATRNSIEEKRLSITVKKSRRSSPSNRKEFRRCARWPNCAAARSLTCWFAQASTECCNRCRSKSARASRPERTWQGSRTRSD